MKVLKKSASLFAMLLFLSIFTVYLPQIGVSQLDGAIYIRADGSVNPSTEFIQRNGDVYTVIGNFDDYVVVEKNNTVFDGAGYTVGGVYGPPVIWTEEKGYHTNSTTGITVVNTVVNGGGITFVDSSNSTIANNTVNNGRGIDCTGNGNIIANNTVNSGRGISGSGKENIITGNHVTNCNYTFVPDNPPPYGISVGGSNNTVIGNYVVGTNGTAIRLGTSSDNIVVGNMIADNKVGIYTLHIYSQGSAHDNLIYSNNFVNNTENVQNDMVTAGFNITVAVNSWDNGTAGNYWSNYNGTDNDGDGIGDTPYIIDEQNKDNYPLMNPVDISTIPEFPSWTTMLSMFSVVTIVMAVYRIKLSKKVNQHR
jgi:hypothetical protein